MQKAPQNEATADVQKNGILVSENKQEMHSPSNSPHIEVEVVGSLAAQNTFIENQQDEQLIESHRSVTEEVDKAGRSATSVDKNIVDDNDNVSEKRLNVAERQEYQADETVTNMSVQVRSGGQRMFQVSVACGEGTGASEEEQNVKGKADVKARSPILQYSSDAAATGNYIFPNISVS